MLYSCIKIKSLDIPKSVKKIGESAFTNTKIEYFDIPSSVNEISNKAFKFCRQLKQVRFENVEHIKFGSGIFF